MKLRCFIGLHKWEYSYQCYTGSEGYMEPPIIFVDNIIYKYNSNVQSKKRVRFCLKCFRKQYLYEHFDSNNKWSETISLNNYEKRVKNIEEIIK